MRPGPASGTEVCVPHGNESQCASREQAPVPLAHRQHPAPPLVSASRHRPGGHQAAGASVVDLKLAPATAPAFRPRLVPAARFSSAVRYRKLRSHFPFRLRAPLCHDVRIARPATAPAPEAARVAAEVKAAPWRGTTLRRAASVRREPLTETAAVQAGLTGPGRVPFDDQDPVTQGEVPHMRQHLATQPVGALAVRAPTPGQAAFRAVGAQVLPAPATHRPPPRERWPRQPRRPATPPPPRAPRWTATGPGCCARPG